MRFEGETTNIFRGLDANADIFNDRDLAAAVLKTSLAKRLGEETNALSTSKKRVEFANDIKSASDASDGNNFLEKLNVTVAELNAGMDVDTYIEMCKMIGDEIS
ncbi:uncharacterized protein LY79DRAFT_666466 [Colletotrichum navitas]|uniref:Uncharacterized protein n=1 Tax=Colletotrichum navitas TaxID=681940 RepID=A0AAD8Q7X3_9PEZI|nr:uncharacterized protein LY79DRAFT_666466 [Colletotrichum navitas]KAK1597631.1 hypothetical protein LY79DRAFT_666466 [Colletotrichum navitas]